MNAAFNKFSQVCLRRGEGPDTADPVPGSATRVNQTNDLRFDGHWSCGHFPTACRVGNNRLMMLKQWLICPESVSILTVFLHALSVFFFPGSLGAVVSTYYKVPLYTHPHPHNYELLRRPDPLRMLWSKRYSLWFHAVQIPLRQARALMNQFRPSPLFLKRFLIYLPSDGDFVK